MPTGFESHLNPPFSVVVPAHQRAAFVFDSPHSGRNYTPQFLGSVRLNRRAIRRSEDFRVDELFGAVAGLGCPILSANFPRAFLDVNREAWELDPRMFLEPLPPGCNTRSARVAGGLGTIARVVAEREEIYARKLSFAEAVERVETLYKPYHAALGRLLADTRARFGHAVLVDCHSMPSSRDAAKRADIVLGDRYGTSCAPAIVEAAAIILKDLGYRVEINKPYAGGFIAEHYGRPRDGLHALQIEISRGLYMDESRLEKSAGFARTADQLRAFVERLIALPESCFDVASPLAAE
jgi:N-formylglutamate amidohydrolase